MSKEYIIEKDWITKAGLRAVILMVRGSHRCGYVGVTSEHSLYGTHYTEIESDIDVHGGITFSDCCEDYPVESNLYWFGFDTAHVGDDPTTGGQPLDYCINQCERLAAQLYKLSANKKRHKHADLIHAWAEGAIIQREVYPNTWTDCLNNTPLWRSAVNYRIKPTKKVIKFRNYLTKFGAILTYQSDSSLLPESIEKHKDFVSWVGDWQQIELEE